MNRYLLALRERIPPWAVDWLDVILPLSQVALILIGAWLVFRLGARLIGRATTAYALPNGFELVTRRAMGFLVYGGALFWILERLGVHGTMLWTAFTGFAAVGAVAFFAVWSVLSNIFCTLLIYTTRMFWPGDMVEIVESGDKLGLKGRVLDINLVFSTIEESGTAEQGTTLRVPNSLFFQRAVRRWHGGTNELPDTVPLTPGQKAVALAAGSAAAAAPAEAGGNGRVA